MRESIIAAGEKLFASEDAAKVSLRKIAALAGYSPGTIYQYFPDQQALFLAIREIDLAAATKGLALIAKSTSDPAERVRLVFVGAVKYWRKHFEQFQVLHSLPPTRPSPHYWDGSTFGQSKAVVASYKLYEGVIRELFDSFPKDPMPLKLATDALIAATHGVISFPMYTRTMNWSNATRMAEAVVNSFIESWSAIATERTSVEHA